MVNKKLIIIGLLLILVVAGCEKVGTNYGITAPSSPQIQPSQYVGGGCTVKSIESNTQTIYIPLWMRL